MNVTKEALYEEIKELPVIDSHEHLPEPDTLPEPDIVTSGPLSYFCADLISAGLTWDQFAVMSDTKLPIEDRWKIGEPFWENARHTGYGRCVERSMTELYGVDHMDSSTIGELQRRFCEANAKPDHYYEVLHKRGNIEVSINDMINDMEFCEDPLFRFVGRIDDLIEENTPEKIAAFGKGLGVDVKSLTDYEEAIEKHLDSLLKLGYVGLKCAVAYRRPLVFHEVARERAVELFQKLLAGEFRSEHIAERRELQDYLMHFVLGAANQRRMLLQIHTGLQAGWGLVTDTDPMGLCNLIIKYPNVRFDLFHIGYPYQAQIGTLAKMFPHVYVDMCWAHIISPVASVRALEEWINLVPVNKIIGFGGDSTAVDVVLGHLRTAQENIAEALAFHVDKGTFSRKEAMRIGKRLLYDNPKTLYGV